jgi:hypothetical protein
VTLKLRLSDFTLRTHARSLARAVEGREEFARLAQGLLDQVLPLPQSVRLMGLTLSALEKRAEGRRCLLWAGGNWICSEKGEGGCLPLCRKASGRFLFHPFGKDLRFTG